MVEKMNQVSEWMPLVNGTEDRRRGTYNCFQVCWMESVCSPSPVVLTNKTRKDVLNDCTRSGKLRTPTSKVDPAAFCKLRLVCSRKIRAVRRAAAFDRPDCVEYNMQQLLRSLYKSAILTVQTLPVETETANQSQRRRVSRLYMPPSSACSVVAVCSSVVNYNFHFSLLCLLKK